MAFWWNVEPLGELEVAHDEGAADHVGVAAGVLGRRVHDDVGAQRQRLLEVRRGEGVVDDEQRAGVVGDRRERLDVADVEQRVGRRLEPDQLGLPGADRGAHRVDVGDRGGGVLDAPRLLDLREQPEGAAVRVVGEHHVVAGPAGGAHQGVLGGQPGGEREARAPPPRAPRARPRARCGWGWPSGSTRSRRAARRRRPACRSRWRRSAGSPRRWWGPARSRRGSRASRTRPCVGAAVRSPGERTRVSRRDFDRENQRQPLAFPRWPGLGSAPR